MKCIICGEEMQNTIGGRYTCDNCGFRFYDCVLRYETKDGKTSRETNVIDTKDLVGTGKITDLIINGKSVTTLDGVTKIETDEGLKSKIKDLEHQLAEKDKEIEEWQQKLLQLICDSADVLNKKTAEIRHEICEEIMQKVNTSDFQVFGTKALKVNKYVKQILDQIEQGEGK